MHRPGLGEYEPDIAVATPAQMLDSAEATGKGNGLASGSPSHQPLPFLLLLAHRSCVDAAWERLGRSAAR